MNTHADKAQQSASNAIANSLPKQQIDGKAALEFEDNSPETIAQRKLQELVNNSSRIQQLRSYQKLANNSPQVKQLRSNQTMANNSKEQTMQRKENLEAETLTEKFESETKKENNTGLPDNLKSGVENISGFSMDDVKVHYNSNKPAQFKAHAYAQGTDIHVASGQECHLPHEAWHVVQQKQGRVQPTLQMKDKVNVNDDDSLEKEADSMGEKAQSIDKIQDPDLQLKGEFITDTIQRARYESGLGGRVRKPSFDNAIYGMDFFDGPDYTRSTVRGAGGMDSSAILGPAAPYIDLWSDADSDCTNPLLVGQYL